MPVHINGVLRNYIRHVYYTVTKYKLNLNYMFLLYSFLLRHLAILFKRPPGPEVCFGVAEQRIAGGPHTHLVLNPGSNGHSASATEQSHYPASQLE